MGVLGGCMGVHGGCMGVHGGFQGLLVPVPGRNEWGTQSGARMSTHGDGYEEQGKVWKGCMGTSSVTAPSPLLEPTWSTPLHTSTPLHPYSPCLLERCEHLIDGQPCGGLEGRHQRTDAHL